jgi:hypothetical protein
MASFLLQHRHSPDECASAYAAWKGFSSPLRGEPTMSSCRVGDHGIWWEVEAGDESEALALLPGFLVDRTVAMRVNPVEIP